MTRGRFGRALVLVVGIAMAIALYLAWARLNGEAPVCGPLHGCETVDASSYSTFLGIPVAFIGLGGTSMMMAGSILWWRTADRRALLFVYILGLFSLPVLAYLAYLEVAVIHAICVWCVGYAIATIATWLISVRAMRTT